MKGHLPPPVKRNRIERLLRLAKRSSQEFRRQFQGRRLDVLWEQQADGFWEGLTGNYIRAYTSADAPLENRLLPVKLASLYGEGMLGDLYPVSETHERD